MSHVLVVDDDASIRGLVAEALEDAEYQVETAANGVEALARVRQHQPSVLLLDLMMPVMDGWRFLEVCRAEDWCKDVPIVLMSAAHLEGEAAALGAVEFLAKPFDLGRLLSTVQRLH